MSLSPPNIKILFVGSNPSNAAASSEAFTLDTVSGRILLGWIDGIEGTVYYENIVSQKTENNRPLKKSEMALASVSLQERINLINPDRIVALGKCAAYVLDRLKLSYFEMPHPSGRNRKLNDKSYVKSKISELQRFCSKRYLSDLL